jgi:alkanesulfonate monooxygenase SsuD/methylene tetrahydromethanopterin reductase-like flavin-dependent oxidoreductase (luciferase family)
MPVRFGATIVQVLPYRQLRDDFVFAESIGLDNAWVIDQFRIDGVPEIPLLEAWTALAAVGSDTERIRIGSMVTNVAMRNPGVLAKSILTVDQISNGRLDVAVGGGYYASEHAALGIDFLDGAGRSRRLRETVAVLDRALRGETVSYAGEHVQLDDALFLPSPTQQPRPALWVAAQGRKSLGVAVEHADAVVTLGEYQKELDVSLRAFRARMEMLDELCVEHGRDPGSLRRCYFAGWADEPIFSSPGATEDIVGRYAEAGATDFTFYLVNPEAAAMQLLVDSHRAATWEQFEEVARDVLPAFRT